jgi:hypothetical protein
MSNGSMMGAGSVASSVSSGGASSSSAANVSTPGGPPHHPSQSGPVPHPDMNPNAAGHGGGAGGGGVGIGVGQLLLRLAHMHEMLMRRPQKSSMEHWRLFVQEFFHETAQFRYLVTLANQQHRVFMMGAETLPRLFHVIYNSGIAQQSIELSDPREYAGVDGVYTLSAREARWRMESDTADAIVELHGTFKVGFVPVPPSTSVAGGAASLRPRHSLKIVFWEFDRQFQREYFAPNARNQGPMAGGAVGGGGGGGGERPRLVNEYGLPPLVMRCFEIADILLYMNDLMRFSVRNQIASPQETLERYYNEFIRPQQNAPNASNAPIGSPMSSSFQSPSGNYGDDGSQDHGSSGGAGGPADAVQRRTSGRKRKRTDPNFTSFDDDEEDDDKDDEEAPPKRPKKKSTGAGSKPPSAASVNADDTPDGDAPSPSSRPRGRKKNPDAKRQKPRADDAEYSAQDEHDE